MQSLGLSSRHLQVVYRVVLVLTYKAQQHSVLSAVLGHMVLALVSHQAQFSVFSAELGHMVLALVAASACPAQQAPIPLEEPVHALAVLLEPSPLVKAQHSVLSVVQGHMVQSMQQAQHNVCSAVLGHLVLALVAASACPAQQAPMPQEVAASACPAQQEPMPLEAPVHALAVLLEPSPLVQAQHSVLSAVLGHMVLALASPACCSACPAQQEPMPLEAPVHALAVLLEPSPLVQAQHSVLSAVLGHMVLALVRGP
mmetsp:Transcript_3547/g.10368  ORF Transcript_3547/g.10368 Transcript_3547/m.10368 type:complete len:256 (+) Transcript_3547:410-1177(+)